MNTTYITPDFLHILQKIFTKALGTMVSEGLVADANKVSRIARDRPEDVREWTEFLLNGLAEKMIDLFELISQSASKSSRTDEDDQKQIDKIAICEAWVRAWAFHIVRNCKGEIPSVTEQLAPRIVSSERYLRLQSPKPRVTPIAMYQIA